MVEDWINKQTAENLTGWDNALVKYYPESRTWMSNPENYSIRLTQECNYLNAVKQLDFNTLLKDNSIIVDMGCGGGWLSAYLSNFQNVAKIYSIDSSQNYLQNFLPHVISLLSGNIEKVFPIKGFFTPLYFKDESIDLIVISSAIHHADNLSIVLDEFYRVLKNDGMLLILNETPSSNLKHILKICRVFLSILYSSFIRKYKIFVQKISSGGFLYDPLLGDIDYPIWYWKSSIINSGFDLLNIHETHLPVVVDSKNRNITLKHFICKKNN
jgi:ubiquinone/menaquinone biosynthesis C-methylase UbiE